MAKTKNLRIVTDELKASGTFNVDQLEQGIILLETEDGEVNLSEYLEGFNGCDVELSIKKKIETVI